LLVSFFFLMLADFIQLYEGLFDSLNEKQFK